MNGDILNVGIVGANSQRSWARVAHVPALHALPDFRLTAVATTKRATAEAAAAAFGASEAYDDFRLLVESPNVDIVVVSVRVPLHLAVVTAALRAGKHVYCEWALGASIEEAEAMADLAERQGVRTAIGLQGQMTPAARRAAELVRSGALGRPLHASIYSPHTGYGPRFASAQAYLMDPKSGANLTYILGGHTLDLAIRILGPLQTVAALPSIMYRDVELTDPPGHVRRSTPDHIFIHGRHASGCALGIELAGNRPTGTPFRLDLAGTSGELSLTGFHPYGFQSSELALEATIPFPAPEPKVAPELTGTPINVAELYAAFGRDIRTGTRTVPDFRHAARLTRLTRAIDRAGLSGQRQSADDWPGPGR